MVWRTGTSGECISSRMGTSSPIGHYHKASDTHDKLDYDRLALVVYGLTGVVEGLAEK